ncbi:MAG: LbtU family siderophore porin [Pseudomonadota bacterium]|nr:LbtU family siderophore porin [Pseudomonadota bacterium]
MTRILSTISGHSALLTAAMLLPLSGYAHKQIDTERELENLRRQVNVLNQKVDHLSVNKYAPGKWQPEATINGLYLRNTFPDFYEIVTQNSPKSNAASTCNCFGVFCVSALGNIDLNLSDHEANPYGNNGSLYGIGVRPVFGSNVTNFIGSITNIDLFIDAAVNKWAGAHIDLAYINASTATRTYAYGDTDWSSAYQNAAALRVNQAYFWLANPCATPFYLQLGRFNTTFGDYEAFPISRSLPQLLEEQRSGGINVGAILEGGFYASANWTMEQQSLDNFTGTDSSLYNGTNRDRNYGGKVGFKGPLSDCVQLDLAASYTTDLRDSDYLSEGYQFYNVGLHKIPFDNFLLTNSFVRMDRARGVAVHAGIDFWNFGIYGDYVTALNSLNPTDTENSKIWAMDVNANIKFCVCGHPVKLEAGYQRAGEANVFDSITAPNQIAPGGNVVAPGFTLPLQMGNVLPEDRMVGTIWVNVMPHVTVAAQWLHDRDFGADEGGTGRASNFGIFRVNVEI